MSTEFRDARLKIKRAKQHFEETKTAILALENSYISATKKNEHGITELIHEVPDCESQLLNLSLIVGDALHNLHSALDFAWASVIKKWVPNACSDNTKFPFRSDGPNLEGALHGIKVDIVCPALFRVVVNNIQPYIGGKGARLRALHELDILDKHLLLLGLTPNAEITGISVRDTNGQIYRGNATSVEDHRGPLFVVPFERGIEVHQKGKLAFNITIKEAGIFEDVPVLELLSTLFHHVTYVVQLLEQFEIGN